MRASWQQKRAEDQERIAELRDAQPIDYAQAAQNARTADDAVRNRLRSYLREFPNHPNAEMWRAVIQKGTWGVHEWRQAAALTREMLDRRAARTAQQEVLFR